MGKTENKKKMSVVKKMMIALIGGLLVGLIEGVKFSVSMGKNLL